MMKITATATRPYTVAALNPEVVVVVVAPPEAVVVVVETEPDAVTVVVVVETEPDAVTVVVVADACPCRESAKMSPGVVPGHVTTATRLQVPTGRMTNT
jgi:hypothetical protein